MNGSGACVKCGGAVQQPPTGRPRSYCSATCKAAARLERDRLQRNVTTMQRGLMQLRTLGLSTPAYLQSVQAEVDAAVARLEALLGADQEPVSG